jgi:hypothetical protein
VLSSYCASQFDIGKQVSSSSDHVPCRVVHVTLSSSGNKPSVLCLCGSKYFVWSCSVHNLEVYANPSNNFIHEHNITINEKETQMSQQSITSKMSCKLHYGSSQR